jgi:hypothetical protein
VDSTPKLPDSHFEPEDLFQILEDATKADEIDFVRCHYTGASELTKNNFVSLTTTAARSASPSMIDYWLENHATLFRGFKVVEQVAL